ncbi:MAG: PAS domain-containing protein [Desulfarculus sp.]|nr:PAS domain-containing protein [Desulfarculus sp.]
MPPASKQKGAQAPPPSKAALPTKTDDFPIVGVGASAGGLEALEQFLGGVPEDSGMAFVIVQHLDPTHQGIMAELLQRGTKMKVGQVKDRTKVQPNCVYVIPPNKDMSILRGSLHLFPPVSPRGLRLPIDFFFRSLAADRGEKSVGVILSGMGSDGSLGLRAIKEAAGVVLVQDPASAKFDGMPKSAIEAGLADFVAPAPELAGKLIEYARHAPLLAKTGLTLESKTQGGLEKAVILLRAHTGHDFSQYKKSTLYRRVERRMGIHQIGKITHYVRFLQENPQELDLLFKELLIGVTSFFRDPAAWETLKDKVLPALLKGCPAGSQLRAWTPGCSTGEEAYSLAMAFKEAVDRLKGNKGFTLQIFATDLDRDAIDKARLGFFPANIAADVSPQRLSRFFVKEETGYRVGKDIREMVTFAPQNVIMDPPFTKLDILICRNLLIYLDPMVQKKLLPLFHYSLNPGGVLFLGSAETIGGFSDLFGPLDAKMRLYRRKESSAPAAPVDFPSSFSPPRTGAQVEAREPKPTPNLQALAEQSLLQCFTPPAVLVDKEGNILFINGRTGKYLEPAAGKANLNIFAMAREGLRYELTQALHQATRQKAPVVLTGLKVTTEGGQQLLDLTVQALEQPEALRGMLMVVFSDQREAPQGKAAGRAPRASVASARLAELERERQQAREEIQVIREEMQTSQEELKSTNEELQSTNEELQSTNEELTTSKEEMQSLNEELQTVNAELQSKVDELSWASNDMKNLLNSTDIACVFLDHNLNLRRFTTQVTKLIKLIPGDVGRPLTDIASDLIYPELASDVAEVLNTLVFREKQVATRDGRWFQARIMPYRTLDNVIDGVVMTFADITVAKELEAKLRLAYEELEARTSKLMAKKTGSDCGGPGQPGPAGL